MVTILLAEDHHIIRRGLRALLVAEPDFKVVGEASSGLEAIRLVESLRPGVLLTDLMMGDISGIEVTRQVMMRPSHPVVLVLSAYGDRRYVVEALRAGARGYVLKESTAAELVEAIREVTAGRLYLSASLAEEAFAAGLLAAGGADAVSDAYDTLTVREREVLHMTARGHTSAQIAERLFISRRTVEVHRANLMRKLGLRNQAQLVLYALRHGILPPASLPGEEPPG